MKFDIKYSNCQYGFKESVYKVHKLSNAGACEICGDLTNWMQYLDEEYLCSEECARISLTKYQKVWEDNDTIESKNDNCWENPTEEQKSTIQFIMEKTKLDYHSVRLVLFWYQELYLEVIKKAME